MPPLWMKSLPDTYKYEGEIIFIVIFNTANMPLNTKKLTSQHIYSTLATIVIQKITTFVDGKQSDSLPLDRWSASKTMSRGKSGQHRASHFLI